MEIEHLIDQISVIIAAIALTITFATYVTNRFKEASKKEATLAELLTKLTNVSEDIKEIKMAQHDFHGELSETHDIATNALDRANYAHERLDRSGLYQHKQREGNDSHDE